MNGVWLVSRRRFILKHFTIITIFTNRKKRRLGYLLVFTALNLSVHPFRVGERGEYGEVAHEIELADGELVLHAFIVGEQRVFDCEESLSALCPKGDLLIQTSGIVV